MIELTMEHTLGKDWLDSFDICIPNAKKPLFQRTEQPFYKLDRTEKNLKGDEVSFFEQMSLAADANNKIFHEGNADLLTRYFQQLVTKAYLKIAFFGGH